MSIGNSKDILRKNTEKMPKDQIWPIIQEKNGIIFDMVFSKVCNLLESSPALYYTEEIKMLREIEEMTSLHNSN